MNAQAKTEALARRIFTAEHFGIGLLYDTHYNAARTLRRAQMTLHRWAELECGTDAGHIEEATGPDGKPFCLFRPAGRHIGGKWHEPKAYRIPDRERGALARVEAVCKATGLHYFHQTDPRGCALYVSAEPLTASNYSSNGIPCI